MNSFGTVHRDAIDIDRRAPVRVQCEAQDCRALLEVNVTPEQRLDIPVIVRCGSCKRLLEVNLAQAQIAAAADQEQLSTQFSGVTSPITGSLSASVTGNYSFIPPLINRIPNFGQRADPQPKLEQEFGLASPPAIRQDVLIQPPPLSRHPTTQRKAAMDSLSHNLTVSSLWCSPSHAFGNTSPFESIYSASSGYDSNSLLELSTGSSSFSKPKQKKAKTSKPRNPSPYNMFMSQEVKHIKATNPSVDHKEAFKLAASNWAKSPNNCSNRRFPLPFKTPTVDNQTALPSKQETKSVALKAQELTTNQNEEATTKEASKRKLSDTLDDIVTIEEKRRKAEMPFIGQQKLSTMLSVGEIVEHD